MGQFRGLGGGRTKCTVSGEAGAKQKREKNYCKMIFIDRSIAAAVRLHYELQAQVRGPWGGRQEGQSIGRALNGPVLQGPVGRSAGKRLPRRVKLTASFIINVLQLL